MSRALTRRRFRSAAAGYTAARFLPRYTLPAGVTYNPLTGLCEGQSWSTGYLPIANEVLLTDQGSAAANRTLLQDTITNANTDAVRIRLAPVSTNWGTNLTIPNRARVGLGMVIEPASVMDAGFAVAEGARVGSGTAGLAPFRATSQTVPVFFFESGLGKVRFVGLDVTWDETFAATLPNVGAGSGTPGINGFFSCYFADEATTEIVIDRCRVRGATGKRTLRGTRLHANRLAILGSRFSEFHDHTIDSQCVTIVRNTRDLIFDNNYFAAAYGEAVILGGGDVAETTERAVTGAILRRNTFDYPYRAQGWPTKNLVETKGAERVVIEGNVFSNYFAGDGFEFGNQFFSIVLKSPHWRVRDWTIRANRFVNCAQWLSVQTEGGSVAGGIDRLELAHNAFLAPTSDVTGARDHMVQLTATGDVDTAGEQLRDFSIRENTVRGVAGGNTFRRFMQDSHGLTATRWAIENNILALDAAPYNGAYYSVPGSIDNTAGATWAARAKADSYWGGNVVSHVTGGQVVPDDIAVASVAELNLDAALRPTSGVTAGKGADIDLIAAAIGSGGGAA